MKKEERKKRCGAALLGNEEKDIRYARFSCGGCI